MKVVTYEGIVEHGQIKLTPNVRLPDNVKVYVIIPEMQIEQGARIVSPRLVHPPQATDFSMEVIEDNSDAGV